MKGRNFSVAAQRAKYVAVDFIMTSLGFFAFNIFRYYVLVLSRGDIFDLFYFLCSGKLIVEQIVVPVCILGIYWLSGYYNHPFGKSRVDELNSTLMSALVSTLIIFLILLINDTTGVKAKDYETILVLFALLALPTYCGPAMLTAATIRHLRRKHWKYNTLIVGNSAKSRDVYRRLKEHGSVWVYDVVGFIRLDQKKQVSDGMQSWAWDDVERVCAEYDVDQIILVPQKIRDADIIRILSRLFPLGIPVKIAPDTLSYITGNIKLNDILGIPFIDLTSPRMSEFQKNVKRTFDVTVSILTMIVLSPALVATAIAVKLSSPGPVLYCQERIGKGRRPFIIYKFRSMRADAEKEGPQLSSDNDNRITPWGKVMRKYRIDELPQFWNVLRGDMSLVGPRPEREFFIRQIVRRAPYYGLIFQVRPGVTSWGMVQYGYASSVDAMVERSRYDLLYLNNMSLSTDVKIMIHTVKTIIDGVGV